MERSIKGYALLWCCLFSIPTLAQLSADHEDDTERGSRAQQRSEESTTNWSEHAPMIDTRANEPVRVLSMRIPFSISPIKGKYEFSFDAHFGNTWNPSGVLEYPHPDEPYVDNLWEAEFHPAYNEAPQRYQFYSADGVIRSGTISFTRMITRDSEIYSVISVNVLVTGKNFIDAPVSDRTIEAVHHVLLGQDDPFRRVANGLDRAEMKFTDRKGRTYEIDPGAPFAGTWDVGYRYFKDIIHSGSTLWNLSLAVQGGIPLNRARQHLCGGVIAGTALTQQFTRTYGLTFALGYVVQNDMLLRIRKEYYDMNYANVSSGYRLLLGHHLSFRNGGRFTVGIEMQGATAPLSANERVQAPYLNAQDIGASGSYAPEYWTEDRPINVTNQRRAARSLIRGSEYLSFNFSYRFGKSQVPPTVTLYFQEDWTVLYDTEGRFLPLFEESNNAQDFGVGLKISKPLK